LATKSIRLHLKLPDAGRSSKHFTFFLLMIPLIAGMGERKIGNPPKVASS
jgi:hypothetical protein